MYCIYQINNVNIETGDFYTDANSFLEFQKVVFNKNNSQRLQVIPGGLVPLLYNNGLDDLYIVEVNISFTSW